MFALLHSRKGDVQEVVVSSSETTLKAEGDRIEGGPLPWQQGWSGGWGSHSPTDDEASFEIVTVRSVP